MRMWLGVVCGVISFASFILAVVSRQCFASEAAGVQPHRPIVTSDVSPRDAFTPKLMPTPVVSLSSTTAIPKARFGGVVPISGSHLDDWDASEATLTTISGIIVGFLMEITVFTTLTYRIMTVRVREPRLASPKQRALEGSQDDPGSVDARRMIRSSNRPVSLPVLDLLREGRFQLLVQAVAPSRGQLTAHTMYAMVIMVERFFTRLMSESVDQAVKDVAEVMTKAGRDVVTEIVMMGIENITSSAYEEELDSFALDFQSVLDGVSLPAKERPAYIGQSGSRNRTSKEAAHPSNTTSRKKSTIVESFAFDLDSLVATNAYRELTMDLLGLAHEQYKLRLVDTVRRFALGYGETRSRVGEEALRQVAEDFSWVPPHVVCTLSGDGRSLANQFKVFVETHLGPNWDWWPLSPIQYPLLKGFRRVKWYLPSGTARHLDLPQGVARALQDALHSGPAFMQQRRNPSATRSSQTTVTTGHGLISRFITVVASGELLPRFCISPKLTSFVDPRFDPGHQAGISSKSRQQHSDRSARPNGSGHDDRQLVVGPETTTTREFRHVYLCIRTGGHSFRPSCLRFDGERTDRDFYRELKARYNASRGLRRRCLSIWRFSHCEFYRVGPSYTGRI
jgi:hypothetical protein